MINYKEAYDAGFKFLIDNEKDNGTITLARRLKDILFIKGTKFNIRSDGTIGLAVMHKGFDLNALSVDEIKILDVL